MNETKKGVFVWCEFNKRVEKKNAMNLNERRVLCFYVSDSMCLYVIICEKFGVVMLAKDSKHGGGVYLFIYTQENKDFLVFLVG